MVQLEHLNISVLELFISHREREIVDWQKEGEEIHTEKTEELCKGVIIGG